MRRLVAARGRIGFWMAVGLGVTALGGLPAPREARGDEEPAAQVLEEVEPNDEAASALALGSLQGLVQVRGRTSHAAARGALAVGDPDGFSFETTDPTEIAATLEMSPGLDLDLALFDPEGRRRATARTDNLRGGAPRMERLVASVDRAGTWRIEVAGFAGSPGSWHLELATRRVPDAPSAFENVPLPDLPEARAFHVAVALPDGDAWIAGGTRDGKDAVRAMAGALSSSARFHATANQFRSTCPLSSPRFGATGTLLPTGEVLVAGGDLAGTADLYDPQRDAMLARIRLPGGMRVMHTATLLPDGRVLLTGGSAARLRPRVAERTLASTVLVDPKSLLATPGPDLATPRTSHRAVLLVDGGVLVIGGVGQRTTEVIDVGAQDGPWCRPGPPLRAPRDDFAAFRLTDGRVVVAGGQHADGSTYASAEVLDDPSAGAASGFRYLARSLPRPASDQSVVELTGGDVLLLGGELESHAAEADVHLAAAFRFDPGTLTFTAAVDLLHPLDEHRAVRLRDGRILLTGGVDDADRATAQTFLYASREPR